MCNAVQSEMSGKLESKIVTLHTGLSNKRRCMHKHCWIDHLSELWNSVGELEGKWQKAKDGMR